MAVDCVTFEVAGAGRDLTYRLIGEGHRRIGLVRIPRGQYAADFEDGYRHAMGSAELPVRPSWVAGVDVDLGETGGSSVNVLLDEGVTAVVAFNEGLAFTVAREAGRRGMGIPGAMSLAAVLTSNGVILPDGVRLDGVCLDVPDLGKAAVRRLSELLAGDDSIPRREGVEASAVRGNSVGTPVAGV